MGGLLSSKKKVPESTEDVKSAPAAGKTQDKVVTDPAANADSAKAAVDPAASAKAKAETPAQTATPIAAGTIDRSEINRNINGSEEPSSADPELWNVDNCEVDILVKYKMGGQMWYVQSRMRENTAKSPAMPIAGFPMNKKADDAKRFYSKDDVNFNTGSTNFCKRPGWKEIEAANPKVSA